MVCGLDSDSFCTGIITWHIAIDLIWQEDRIGFGHEGTKPKLDCVSVCEWE